MGIQTAPADETVSEGKGVSVMSNPSKWIAAIAMTTSVAISSCSYGSKYEAEIACNKWIEKGGFYTEYFDDYEYNFENFTSKEIRKEEKLPLRYCKEEAETEQFFRIGRSTDW